MQLYILPFCPFSIKALPKIEMKSLFDYFWKPIGPFLKFALSIFWDSTSYTVLFVFWVKLMEPNNALARFWPCMCLKSVSGVQRIDKFWPFWDAYMSLPWCSNTVQT